MSLSPKFRDNAGLPCVSQHGISPVYKLSGLDHLCQMVGSFGLAYEPAHTDSGSKKVQLWPEINCREYCPSRRPTQVQSLFHLMTVFVCHKVKQ